MWPDRRVSILLFLLLVNAAAILCFRYFITVDGPLHVLHASLLDVPWTSQVHLAKDITYDSSRVNAWTGQYILNLLLVFFGPELAHDLFAVIVSSAFVLSVAAFLLAQGMRIGLSILWLAPATYNIILIMGLFHFLLGVAIGFATVAWWISWGNSPKLRWIGLLIGVFLAWSTHRGAPAFMFLLFIPVILAELHKAISIHDRRSVVRSIALVLIFSMVLAIAFYRTGLGMILTTADAFHVLDPLFLVRPLILFDESEERSILVVIAFLLLIAVIGAAWTRWHLGRKLFKHDAFIILFGGFILASWIFDTPMGRRFLLVQRFQWLALLMLLIWLVPIAEAGRGWVAKAIGGAALFALPFHFIRMVHAEESFHHLQAAHILALESAEDLTPNSLVLIIVSERERLLQHLGAFVAIRHKGIILSPKEELFIRVPVEHRGERWLRIARDPYWLARHWRSGIPSEVDQVMFLGEDIDQMVSRHPWHVLLVEYGPPTFENSYVRIYTIDRHQDPVSNDH